MLKISTKEDCLKLSRLPPQVQGEVEDIIARLNFYYGEHRNTETDMGGYALIIEDESDFETISEIFNQPLHELMKVTATISRDKLYEKSYKSDNQEKEKASGKVRRFDSDIFLLKAILQTKKRLTN